jgi:TRAP-type C4-dicarboxylate transport system substrate-binding protein
VTPCALIINDDIWSTVPADVQAYMSEVLSEALRAATDSAMASEETYVQQFRDVGIEVIEPDKDSFAAFVPDLFEHLGVDTAAYDSIRAAIDG